MKLTISKIFAFILIVSAYAACTKSERIGAESIALNKTELALYRGQQEKLEATVQPGTAETSAPVWKSSNESVATISQTGEVTAIKPGKTAISVATESWSASCIVTVMPNIYVVGAEKNDKNISVATLWVNGVKQSLSEGTGNAIAFCMAISDNNDIYVGGYEQKVVDGPTYARIWKNGKKEASLSEEQYASAINGIALAGTDVYTVGNRVGDNEAEDGGAALWKNGTPTFLTDNTYVRSAAYSIVIQNNITYICGTALTSPTVSIPVLWENGAMTILDEEAFMVGGTCVLPVQAGTQTNVYVSGFSQEYNSKTCLVKLWTKTGNQVSGVTLDPNGVCYTLLHADGNLYAGGYTSTEYATTVPVIWKNGYKAYTLGQVSPDKSSSVAGLAFFNDDLYAAGDYDDRPTMWRNGTPTILSDTRGEVHAIVIK